eukprot:gene4543-biopygen11506
MQPNDRESQSAQCPHVPPPLPVDVLCFDSDSPSFSELPKNTTPPSPLGRNIRERRTPAANRPAQRGSSLQHACPDLCGSKRCALDAIPSKSAVQSAPPWPGPAASKGAPVT